MLIFRLLLIAVPFIVWFVWRDVARRTGRPMGATPWVWLVAAAGLLFGLSLMAIGFIGLVLSLRSGRNKPQNPNSQPPAPSGVCLTRTTTSSARKW